MSSSDSSDEDNSAFREAVDSQFMNDDMYKSIDKTGKRKTSLTTESSNTLPSLRRNANNQDQFNLLDVTSEFQEFVAKRLSAMLEGRLQKSITTKETVRGSAKRKKGGIRLLSDSTSYVKVSKRRALCNNTVVMRNGDYECNSEDEAKCKEASVAPEDILNKKDVKYWTNRRKEKLFKYKSKKGVLVSMD